MWLNYASKLKTNVVFDGYTCLNFSLNNSMIA